MTLGPDPSGGPIGDGSHPSEQRGRDEDPDRVFEDEREKRAVNRRKQADQDGDER